MPHLRKPKSKYKAVFLQKTKTGYVEVDSAFIVISEETFSYKGHSYEVKLENKLFEDMKGNKILYYTIDGGMLAFDKAEPLMDTEELDDYVEKNIFGKLGKMLREALGGTKTSWLMPIIVGAVIGGAIGYFVGMNYTTHTVIQYLNNTSQPPHI